MHTTVTRSRSFRGLLTVGLAISLAAPAAAVPSSLRSARDVSDLVDTFMSNVVASDVKGAYRLAAQYWPLSSSELGRRIDEAQKRRLGLRGTMGLSLGFERVSSEEVGDRVVRITQLERFDKGALVWRFVFYRAENIWQLIEVSETDDLTALFGAP